MVEINSSKETEMNQINKYGLVGISIPILFVITYLILSSMRPEYSHLHKAISVLGSLDAPNKWWWNILGYIIPGILISLFSVGLHKSIDPKGNRKLAFGGLFLSGLFMSLSGIFPGDFEDRASTTMILHSIASIASFIFFLVAAFSYPNQLKNQNTGKRQLLHL